MMYLASINHPSGREGDKLFLLRPSDTWTIPDLGDKNTQMDMDVDKLSYGNRLTKNFKWQQNKPNSKINVLRSVENFYCDFLQFLQFL